MRSGHQGGQVWHSFLVNGLPLKAHLRIVLFLRIRGAWTQLVEQEFSPRAFEPWLSTTEEVCGTESRRSSCWMSFSTV